MADLQHLVLIPGLVCDARLWAAQVTGLTEMATISIADHARVNGLAGMAEDILARAPERFAVAGLSMGGYLAMEMWRQAPRRITKFAVLDTNARADDTAGRAKRNGAVTLALEGQYGDFIDGFLPVVLHPDHLEGRAGQLARSMAEDAGAETMVRQQRAIMERPDSRETLQTVNVPSLVICGADDALSSPALHREMADLMPHSTFVEIQHCGHFSPIEQPDAVTSAMRRWLET